MTPTEAFERLQVRPDAPPRVTERLRAAIEMLLAEFGSDWFDKEFPANRFSASTVPAILEYYSALETSGRITNGKELRAKLLKESLSTGSRAIAEAQVAQRLLGMGATVEYEPPDVEPKVPDLKAVWSTGDEVLVEVCKLELSHQDQVQWQQKQAELSNRMSSLLHGGVADVYINNTILDDRKMTTIVDALRNIVSNDTGEYVERLLDEETVLAYDPTGSIRADRANPPPESSEGLKGVLLEDPSGDRSIFIMQRYFPGVHMPKVVRVSIHVVEPGRNRANIVRVHKAAEDKRLIQKVIAESSQLSHSIPGIVALDISKTTARPKKWASAISDLYATGLYAVVSGVWVRSGYYADYDLVWDEYLSVNELASHHLGDVVLERFQTASSNSE